MAPEAIAANGCRAGRNRGGVDGDAAATNRLRITDVAQQLTIETSTNVGTAERLASMALGGVLVMWAFRKRSSATMAAGIVGADLIYRGASGHCGVYGALGVNTAATTKTGGQISSS